MAWQDILKTNITSVRHLLQLCHIHETENYSLSPSFPVSVPLRLISKIEKSNAQDPLFLQCVPRRDEERSCEGFCTDPLDEQQAQKSCAILQKYAGRALLLAGPSCCMHCRFCFRRHKIYPIVDTSFSQELSWIRANKSISEIILSGGDPLCLPTNTLASLLQQLDLIHHIRRIRFHTRVPIGIPERIDEDLLTCLKGVSKQVLFVVHINHPKELDADVIRALSAVLKMGIPILTQTVLLKGVNDDLSTLEQLFQDLGSNGFIPYYLHQLDRVQGAHHFEVPIEKGRKLMDQLHSLLPGYLVPRYVAEIAGRTGKTQIR